MYLGGKLLVLSILTFDIASMYFYIYLNLHCILYYLIFYQCFFLRACEDLYEFKRKILSFVNF